MSSLLKTDVADTDLVQPREVRVLNGLQEGASADLSVARSVTIGRGLRNDIVLRDRAVGEARVRVERGPKAAVLKTLAGEVSLLGRPVGVGESAIVPEFVPFQLGGVCVAIGASDDDRWTECQALVQLPEMQAGEKLPERRILPFRVAALGGAAVVALLVAVLAMPRGAGLEPLPSPEVRANALLTDAERALVSITPVGAGVTAEGRVATDEVRRDVCMRIQSAGISVQCDIVSGETMARNVSDIYAASGLSVDTAYVGSGTVSVSGLVAEPSEIAHLREVVLRDVPGLDRLMIAGAAKPSQAGMTLPFTAEVASVVAGSIGYVTTRNGDRYFIGAVLPGGAILTDVQRNAITVREDDDMVEYVF